MEIIENPPEKRKKKMNPQFRRLFVEIDAKLHERLMRVKQKTGVTLKAVVEKALRRGMR